MFQENTLEDLLVDGGVKKMLEVVAVSQDNSVVIFCSNVPMIIFKRRKLQVQL